MINSKPIFVATLTFVLVLCIASIVVAQPAVTSSDGARATWQYQLDESFVMSVAKAKPVLYQVGLNALDITTGSIRGMTTGYLSIEGPEVRAVEESGRAQSASLRFRYRGPTSKTALLDSGALVRQIGLKMRARNSCNVLYVMWEIERSDGSSSRSQERLKITLKRNPGKEQNNSRLWWRDTCGTRGYVDPTGDTDRGSVRIPLEGIVSAKDGREHLLQTDLYATSAKAYDLIVSIDGRQVWRGQIDNELLDGIDGPAGLRTDNGRFVFKLFTGRKAVCRDAVQGKIAWDHKGHKNWDEQNIERLCKGNESSVQPAQCFAQIMHGSVNWGNQVRKEWQAAVDLCEGVFDATTTVSCFQRNIDAGSALQQAVAACDS